MRGVRGGPTLKVYQVFSVSLFIVFFIMFFFLMRGDDPKTTISEPSWARQRHAQVHPESVFTILLRTRGLSEN